MENTVKKSDFVLTPYMKSNNWRATYQILNTLVPYFCLWLLAAKAATVSLWLLPPIIALMVLFSVRCFSLMHDCGHYSLFTSKKVNRVMGFILGVVNAMPQYSWSRDHAYHHKTNGDWERYRGVADFLSVDEFAQLSPKDQKVYEVLRHPFMSLPGGFFYLAFKPRLALLIGVYELLKDMAKGLKVDAKANLGKLFVEHKSKHWNSVEEFWDLLFNNIFVVSGWVILCHFLGTGFFLSVYSIVMTFSASIFILTFFVQHIFEGSYAHRTEDWDYLKGAIEGSSHLEFPLIMRWFSADIGYHNIHHLSERIPNYNLEACHYANEHLLTKAKRLKISEMLGCARFILWEPTTDSLVSVEHYRKGFELKMSSDVSALAAE
jgi:acyl-lipid omega-6 desaturase (Delta-12 desaturase)